MALKGLAVPWMQWKRFRVEGVVREVHTGRPRPGLRVCAFDQDLLYDDFLGDCETDAEGRFEIGFSDVEFKDAFETRPDLYLHVFLPGEKKPIADTSGAVRRNADRSEFFEIQIPRMADV